MTIFKYDYVPPESMNIRKVLKEGEGSFHVTAVSNEKNSQPMQDKNGCAMIKLTLRLTDANRQTTLTDDYLTGSAPSRIKTFADAVGQPGLYNPSGALDISKLVGLSGKCMIKTDSYTTYDGSERVSSKVGKYIVAPTDATNELPNDDLPF